MTVKKEYDIYGNLILNINVERFEYEVSTWDYARCSDLHPRVIYESRGTALFTDGYCIIYTYDERNNVLTEEKFSYWGLPNCKRLFTYLYSYSEDGRILEKTEFYEEIPLLDTEEEIDETIKAIHLVNKYDVYNNLIEELRYDFCLPAGSEKSRIEVKDNKPEEKRRFKNIYNERGKLIEVFNRDTMELMAEFSYDSGRLDTKVVYVHGEEIETIKYIYSGDSLIREEYYSDPGILMKIIEHVNIRGRMCQRVLSPAKDNLRWYLSSFNSYHRC